VSGLKILTKSQVLKILSFLLIVALSDQFIGYILRRLYFTQNTGQSANLNYVLKECKSDILIFGNSRAQHHYDTRILSDSLHMSCYNAGQDGGHSILLQYAQIKIISERYSPKIIILEFSPENIVYYSDSYDKLSILLPYYSEYPSIRQLILLRSQYEKCKLISAVYPYNSDIINIIRYNTNTHSARKRDFGGYIPIIGKALSNNMLKREPAIKNDPIIDTNLVIALKNIIEICKEKNIVLFIFNSPFYFNKLDTDQTKSVAKISLEIIKDNNVEYTDYSKDSAFSKHMNWFADYSHLNKAGADAYSNIVVNKIKEKRNK
jgi:hypothetical protein